VKKKAVAAKAPRKTRAALPKRRRGGRDRPLTVWRERPPPPRTPRAIRIQLDDENRPVIEGILHVLRDRMETLRAMPPHEYRPHRYLAAVSVTILEHMLTTNPHVIMIDAADDVRYRVISFLDDLCAEGVRQIREANQRALAQRAIETARMRAESQWAVCQRCHQTVRIVNYFGEARLEAHLPCGIDWFG